MAPVARKLSSILGVLEPLQTATTIEGQVEELKIVLLENGAIPITIIGFSWGAMLSFIFTRAPMTIKNIPNLNEYAHIRYRMMCQATTLSGIPLLPFSRDSRYPGTTRYLPKIALIKNSTPTAINTMFAFRLKTASPPQL
ncbi:hypothetical protein ACFLV0_02310 [Chloroflexota bacterium]